MKNILERIKNFFLKFFNNFFNQSKPNKCEEIEFPIRGIYFFKEECPHCKNFSIDFDNFIAQIKPDENKINFEKISIQNEIKDEEISKIKESLEGVPYIIFLDANNKIIEKWKVEGNDIEALKDIYKEISEDFNKNCSMCNTDFT